MITYRVIRPGSGFNNSAGYIEVSGTDISYWPDYLIPILNSEDFNDFSVFVSTVETKNVLTREELYNQFETAFNKKMRWLTEEV